MTVMLRRQPPNRAPDPVGDPARLAVLRGSELLHAGNLPGLDRLTALAARLLDAPIALVTLVDEAQQVFLSDAGLTGELAASRKTPLSHSYCQHTAAADAPLIVGDARADARLWANPAIAAFDAIAYAGIPLHHPGGPALGTLCVVDHRPGSGRRSR
ncbi:GAF domain-containing protein [Dactylosporangium sp. NPDC051541]|uniref:GAF domain-containing protein n=1 Tax=Dactylosporangium sp. NPDC051541 TaxID=3363977 RepID=UPI0037B8F6EC